jgi:hypothetical protein
MVRWWRYWRSRGVVIGILSRRNLNMMKVYIGVTYEGRGVMGVNYLALWLMARLQHGE